MWSDVLKMPKLLCLLFLIGISSVYATPFANNSTARTTLSPTAITSTGMFVPLYLYCHLIQNVFIFSAYDVDFYKDCIPW